MDDPTLRRSQRKTFSNYIATYNQLLMHPITAFNAFRRYWDVYVYHKEIHSISKKHMKKFIRKCKRWLTANQLIWSTIANHLPVGSDDVYSQWY